MNLINITYNSPVEVLVKKYKCVSLLESSRTLTWLQYQEATQEVVIAINYWYYQKSKVAIP